MADTFDVVIIGGGHAGLATAASVRRQCGEAVKLVVLEGSPRIGNSWHKRYNRLHLHTPKSTSSLPFFPMPKSYPMYVAKEQVRDYLEMYAKELGLPVQLRHHVSTVTYNPADKTYSVDVQVWEGDDGDKGGYAAPTSGTVRSKTLTAKCVVLAMGPESVPFTPDVPGRDTFKGHVLHSTQYKDGAAFKGQNVLVVGFGNSAGEIALCLWEHGARPTMLVRRSTVACMGRDDGLVTALLFNLHIKKHLKPYFRLLDKIMDPVMILKAPNLRPHGVPQVVPAYFGNPGILEGIVQHFEPPAMDVGQFHAIKRGQIKVVRGELRGYSAAGALIAPPAAPTGHGNGNGEAWGPTQTLACDAIILCTGYDHTASLRALLPPDLLKAVLPPGFVRPPSGVETASPGLFILGWEDFAGRIALIGQEAQDVAAGIGKRLGVTATSKG